MPGIDVYKRQVEHGARQGRIVVGGQFDAQTLFDELHDRLQLGTAHLERFEVLESCLLYTSILKFDCHRALRFFPVLFDEFLLDRRQHRHHRDARHGMGAVSYTHLDQPLMKAATHFNPVDLVCGVRDSKGRKFDLRRYTCLLYTSWLKARSA